MISTLEPGDVLKLCRYGPSEAIHSRYVSVSPTYHAKPSRYGYGCTPVASAVKTVSGEHFCSCRRKIESHA